MTTLEQLALEIGAQPKTKHGDAEPVDYLTQLINLFSGQELGFIDQNAMDVFLFEL